MIQSSEKENVTVNKTRVVIGVTGPICSGKNEVCRFLIKRNFYHIDVDLLGHNALEEKTDRIIELFGKDILDESGNVSRKKLGRIVFSNKKALAKLEAVVHPWMRNKVGELLLEHKTENIVINAAVLFRMEMDHFCDKVIWVDAPRMLRALRLKRRSGKSFFAALKMILTQNVIRTQYSVLNTDIYDIRNSGSREYLADQVWKFLNEI